MCVLDSRIVQKRALRREILAARDLLSAEDVADRSIRIFDHLKSLPELRSAKTVHLFVSFGTEVDTGPIFRALWRQGARTVAPRVLPRQRLEHRVVSGPDDLEPGFRSIPEPRVTCPLVSPAEIDLVLLPGVAFDPSGGRLGYGGGYYDRFLLACPAPRVALAFSLQIVEAVPREPHDLRADVVVTDTEVIRISP